MKSYRPQGQKLLVLTSAADHQTTEGVIIAVDHTLCEATVVEVGSEVTDIYKKGDTILIPQKTGVAQFHNGKQHLWINGSPAPQGDVWSIVINDL